MAAPLPFRIRSDVRALRTEARLLSIAGYALLLVGALGTIALIFMGDQVSPFAPLLFGVPFTGLGWLICRYASSRLVAARALEEGAGANTMSAVPPAKQQSR